jgi:tetratricopeptide (TPR) repeat protein
MSEVLTLQPAAQGASGSGRGLSRARHRLVLILFAMACLIGIYPLQNQIQRDLEPGQSRHEELLFMPAESRVSHFAGGYSGLLATIYWTRAVQYYGRHRLAHSRDFALLGTLLDTATSFDPHLLVAYRFGSLFLAGKLPEGAGDPQRAINLLQRGIVANPTYWRLWEDLGFIYYWDMKDYAHAARAFQTGSERPGALPWMRVLAASVAAEGGETKTSRILWSEIAQSAANDQIRRTAEMHLAVLDTQEALRRLDALIEAYRAKTGKGPRSFQDLVAAGLMRGIPLDLSGERFVIGADGKTALGPGSKIDLDLGE